MGKDLAFQFAVKIGAGRSCRNEELWKIASFNRHDVSGTPCGDYPMLRNVSQGTTGNFGLMLLWDHQREKFDGEISLARIGRDGVSNGWTFGKKIRFCHHRL